MSSALERQMSVIDGAQRPADDETRIQVEDGRQVQLAALADHELRGVADPALVGRFGRELAVEELAAIGWS